MTALVGLTNERIFNSRSGTPEEQSFAEFVQLIDPFQGAHCRPSTPVSSSFIGISRLELFSSKAVAITVLLILERFRNQRWNIRALISILIVSLTLLACQ